MDLPSKSASDPLTLLLNEIEILLTQSRLVELYFKQSQATAAYEGARAREQHQAELTGLRAALAEKNKSWPHAKAPPARKNKAFENKCEF